MPKYGSMQADFKVSPESFGISASRSSHNFVNRSSVYGWMFLILTLLFVPGICTTAGASNTIDPYRCRAAFETWLVIFRSKKKGQGRRPPPLVIQRCRDYCAEYFSQTAQSPWLPPLSVFARMVPDIRR